MKLLFVSQPRKDTIHQGITDRALEAIQDQLNEHRRLVAELSTGEDRKIAEARISFYEALENYRKGNRADSARLLSGASDSLGGDDPFFSHFQQLVQADAQ